MILAGSKQREEVETITGEIRNQKSEITSTKQEHVEHETND